VAIGWIITYHLARGLPIKVTGKVDEDILLLLRDVLHENIDLKGPTSQFNDVIERRCRN